MGLHSYIKRLKDYVSGATGTYVPNMPASTVDVDGTGTDLDIGTYVHIYRDTLNHVSASDFINQNGDGTGIAELWRYRSQFEINANTTGNYPTVAGIPDMHPAGYAYPGRSNRIPFSIKEAIMYLALRTVNHTAAAVAPFKYGDLRGAEAYYLTFINGKPERDATKSKNFCCPLKCIGWKSIIKCIKCGGLKWAVGIATAIGVIFVIIAPGIGVTAMTLLQGAITGAAMGAGIGAVAGDKADKRKCYKYTYFNDGEFTVQVNGGYSTTGKFLATLSSTTGLIKEFAVKEQQSFKFDSLKGSNSGQQGFNIGSYTLRLMDVITKQEYRYEIFVPYNPYGSAFGIKARMPGNLYKYETGNTTATTFIPNIDNAHWIWPGVISRGETTEAINQEPFQDDGSTCAGTRINFFSTILASTLDIQWRFSWEKRPPFPAGVTVTPTTMTPLGGWTLEPAANLMFNKLISATVVTPFDANNGTWQLELSSSTITKTLTSMIDDTTNTEVPATFLLLADPTSRSDLFDVSLDPPTSAQTSKIAARDPITGLLTGRFDYVATITYAAACCDSMFVECSEYTGNKNDTWWDQTISTAFDANSASLPPIADRVGIPLNTTLPGNLVSNAGSTFTFNINNEVPGSVFTFVVRARPTMIPLTPNWAPESFYTNSTDIDPTTGAIISTSVTKHYTVLTLT